MIGRYDAAGSGHVVHNDPGVPGNVLGEMAGDEARVLVIASTSGEADNNSQGLAAVEVSYGLLVVTRSGWRRRLAHGK